MPSFSDSNYSPEFAACGARSLLALARLTVHGELASDTRWGLVSPSRRRIALRFHGRTYVCPQAGELV